MISNPSVLVQQGFFPACTEFVRVFDKQIESIPKIRECNQIQILILPRRKELNAAFIIEFRLIDPQDRKGEGFVCRTFATIDFHGRTGIKAACRAKVQEGGFEFKGKIVIVSELLSKKILKNLKNSDGQ